MTIRNWIKERERHGRPTFSFTEVVQAFKNMPVQQIRNALYRLAKQKAIMSVYRGFYSVIPAHYALREMVPPIYYIDSLMDYLGKPYYISLLSAAELHGAAHQRPQKFLVTTLRPVVRTSTQKNNYIVWIYRTTIPENLLSRKNSETGTICYSNAEFTAVDLLQHVSLLGGISAVATVLSELVEETDFAGKEEALLTVSSVGTLQRLGYILDEVLEEHKQAMILYKFLKKKNLRYIPLSAPHSISDIMERNTKWKIILNEEIDLDI